MFKYESNEYLLIEIIGIMPCKILENVSKKVVKLAPVISTWHSYYPLIPRLSSNTFKLTSNIANVKFFSEYVGTKERRHLGQQI